MRIFKALSFLLVFTFFTNAVKAQNTEQEQILARQMAFAETIKKLDWGNLPAFLSEEAIYIHSFGRVDTKADLLKNIARFKSCSQWEHKNISVNIKKNIALIHSDLYVTLGLPDGTESSSQQRSTEVWIKQNKIWVLLSHQSTSFK